MTVKDFLKKSFETQGNYPFRPLIYCVDGFTMSVQASSTHYCSPRTYTDEYSSVEVGFPSEQTPALTKYVDTMCENPEDADHTNSVFGWVPVDVLDGVQFLCFCPWSKHKGKPVEFEFWCLIILNAIGISELWVEEKCLKLFLDRLNACCDVM